MKRLQRLVAVALILGLLLSLICVCTLYAYPTHTHESDAAHCVLCAIAAKAPTLLHTAHASVKAAALLLLLLLFAAVTLPVRMRQSEQRMTPITLKTKLTT